jgi:hypothetical protein
MRILRTEKSNDVAIVLEGELHFEGWAVMVRRI